MKNRWLVLVGISVLYHLILLLILSQVRFGTVGGKSIVLNVQLVKETTEKVPEAISKSSNAVSSKDTPAQKAATPAEEKKVPAPAKEKPAAEKNNPVQKPQPAQPIIAKDIFRPDQILPDFQQTSINRNNFASMPTAGNGNTGMTKLSPGSTRVVTSSGGGNTGGHGSLAPDPEKMGSGKAAAENSSGGGFTANRDPGFFQFGQPLITSDRGNWSAPAGNGGESFGKMVRLSPGSSNNNNNNNNTGSGPGISTGNDVNPANYGSALAKIISSNTGSGANVRSDNVQMTSASTTGDGRGGGYDKPAQQIAANPNGKIAPGAITRGGGSSESGVSTATGTRVGPTGGGVSDRGGAGTASSGSGVTIGHSLGGKLMPGGSPDPGKRGNVVADAPVGGSGGGYGHISASSGGGVTYSAEISGLSKIGKVPSIIEEENLLGRIPGKSCTVIVDVQVGSSGQAMNVTLVKSTVFNTINNNAIYIARKIEYRPGMKNGIASPTTIRLEIKYIDGKTDPEIRVV